MSDLPWPPEPLVPRRPIPAWRLRGPSGRIVCCEIVVITDNRSESWFFHKETANWEDVLRLVGRLPGFDSDWRAKVIQPPFAESRTVAFKRQS